MNLKSITGSIYKSSSTTPGIGISITLNTLHPETFFFLSQLLLATPHTPEDE